LWDHASPAWFAYHDPGRMHNPPVLKPSAN
jgi:hypothetical protein